jgi:predicted dehydrogenase
MALKVVVVGARGIGSRHAECYSRDGLAQLVGVCDVIRERADALASERKVKAYYRLKDVLDAEPDLDIVDVSTGGYENGSWHYDPAMEGLEAGKHVIVEKPLSNDVREARDLVAKAEEKGLYLACNLNHYFTPAAEKAREYVKAGKVGELVYCLHRMGFPGGERAYSVPRGFRVEGLPYFHVKAFLTHPFSVMRFFCGDVTHVQAFLSRPSYRKAAGDVMLSVNSIHLLFENGCVGYLLSQRGDSTFGLGGWWSLEVGGTRGTFCVENCVEKTTFWPAPGSEGAAQPEKLGLGQSPAPTVHETGIRNFDDTFPRRLHAFLEDVANKVPRDRLRGSGRDALAALEYTWAAMESYQQGGALVRPYPLPEMHGRPEDQTAMGG